MPRIRCHYEECIHLDSGLCGADVVELDPEMGCLTFAQEEDIIDEEEEWDEDLEDDWEELDEELDEEDLDEEEW